MQEKITDYAITTSDITKDEANKIIAILHTHNQKVLKNPSIFRRNNPYRFFAVPPYTFPPEWQGTHDPDSLNRDNSKRIPLSCQEFIAKFDKPKI